MQGAALSQLPRKRRTVSIAMFEGNMLDLWLPAQHAYIVHDPHLSAA